MLKKLRRRFIVSAMAAFFAVITLIVAAVNLWNYDITCKRQDENISNIIKLENRPHDEQHGISSDFPLPGPFGGHSREARFMNRYFAVRIEDDRLYAGIDKENIASITEEEAQDYALHILSKNKTSGFYKNYRYIISSLENGQMIVFLNSEREIQSMKTLLLVSGIIAAISLGTVFLLVSVFSGRAIEPYIRNIETQKRFITDAGHELKTPLTSISASAEILAMEDPENEWVSNILSQSEKMSKLIKSLVKLSRLDEQQTEPEMAEFSLSEALWETAEPAAAAAKAKSKEYSQDIEDSISYCGNRSNIQQMVSSLLDNAVKYSDEHGKISLTLRRSRKKIIISVYNTTAPDIDIDTEKIFERFYRGDMSRTDTDSFGIGLSAAQAIAERHRGKITAIQKDGGIEFRVVL